MADITAPERPFVDDPLMAARFEPGAGDLLVTVVDLLDAGRDGDPARDPPLGDRVDWDALDHLLDADERAGNVASVSFSYGDHVVRISGRGAVELYDDPEASEGASTPTDAAAPGDPPEP
jgi:hypothetical protein